MIPRARLELRASACRSARTRTELLARIVEAYGFDLSPIATRHAEFVRLAEEARAERAEFSRLRQRATIARSGITQILETVAEYGFAGEEWTRLKRDTQNLVRALRKVERPEEMAVGVESLERRQRTGRERLEILLAEATVAASKPVNPDPLAPENGPHHYTYKPSPDPEQDTVLADKAGSGGGRHGRGAVISAGAAGKAGAGQGAETGPG